MKKSQQRKHTTTYGSNSGGGCGSDGGDDGPVHCLKDDDAVAAEMSSLVNSTESTADPKTVSSDVRWKTSLKASKSLIDGGSQVERSADMVRTAEVHLLSLVADFDSLGKTNSSIFR